MQVDRAQGCLLGQLAGDALGGLVEFQSPEQIRRDYPGGVRAGPRECVGEGLLRSCGKRSRRAASRVRATFPEVRGGRVGGGCGFT